MNRIRSMVILGLIISQALILHLLEGYMPVLAPGMKLGLANIMTLVTLTFLDLKRLLLSLRSAQYWVHCLPAVLPPYFTVLPEGF